jgi:ABC-2 type transport system permease protein
VAVTDTPTRESATSHFQRQVPLALRSVGLKSVWDQRFSLLWWTGGTALMSALIVGLYPYIDTGEELEALFEQLPGPIQAMIGEQIDLSTAAGYLDIRMFTTIAPIILLVYAIWRGMASIAGEEGRGTLDLLLAQPVKRWRVIVENAASMFFGLIAIGLALWLGLIGGALLMNVEFSFTRAGAATLMTVLLGMVFGALALAIGAQTGKSGLATGISAAVAVGTYLLHGLAPLVDWLEPARVLSPFYFAIGNSVMLQGFKVTYAGILVAIALTLIVLAAIAFQRRDIQLG